MGWFSRGKKLEDRTMEILGRHIDQDFTVYPLGEGAASADEVRALGAGFGVAFPDPVVAHLSGRFPGAILLASEQVWPRPQPLDVAPFWQFLYGVHSFTPLATSEDWMRLDLVARDFQAESGHCAVPVLKRIGDANLMCVDSNGNLFDYDHEEGGLTPIGFGFWDLLDREVRELVERRNRLVQEGAV